MFKNYLKVALQILFRNRIYSLVNILGLGIGLACCLLILLYVRFELSYEKQFENAPHIYRISKEIFPADGARLRVPASNNGPVAQALVDDYQEVAAAGRIYGGTNSLKVDETVFLEPEVRFADQSILQIFDFEWLAGDPRQALKDPGSIVLTESLARKIFGSTDVLGTNLEVPGAFELKVSGVIKDIAANSHLSLSGMISMASLQQMLGAETFQRQFSENWNSNTDFYTYLLLAPQANVESLGTKMPDFINRHIAEGASEFMAMRIMNIRDIHLRSNRDEEWKPPGNIASVYSFSVIALAILIIACINFMSIATSRSAQRSREIGARLAVGATRKQLIVQFLGESALTALFSMILAVVMVELLLPSFSSFVGNSLVFDWFSDRDLLLALLLLTAFVAFFSGSYPALYLSAMKPVAVLKGEMRQGKNSLWLRNSMVMVQFAIAITLVVCAAVIYLQRQYAINVDMGFEKDRIVVLPALTAQGYNTADWPAFRQALLAEPAIESVTTSHYLPFGFNDNQMPLRRRGTAIETQIQYMQVDYEFFDTYEIATVAGRVFSRETVTDNLLMPTQDNPGRVSFVLNESAARALAINPQEFSEEALEVVQLPIAGPVLGIVQDTYFESIRRDVRPMIYIVVPPEAGRVLQRYLNAAIRIKEGSAREALSQINTVWQSFYPDRPNNSYFLDADFRALYEDEDRQGQLLSWFATLAIVIASFGLFGLASFNAERRTKEIGVRKVMGGSVWSIVLLLSNDFSKLVLLSNLIAWPVAYVAMERWLENFAYRIDLTPLIFIGSGLIALCIAWVTVGGTAAKAASQRPVLALRYE